MIGHALILMTSSPGSTLLSRTKPPLAASNSWPQISQRQFGLAARVSLRRCGRGRRRGTHETPADRRSVARILADHDLGGAAGSIVARQEHAVFEPDLVVQRLKGPEVAVGEYQHDTAGVAETTCLHRGVQIKPQRVIGLVPLDPPTRRRR